MPSPLTVSRNDYHRNPKASTIYTPVGVAQFLFDTLERPQYQHIFDPAIGSGRLTDPWHETGRNVCGCDIHPKVKRSQYSVCFYGPFEEADPALFPKPDLVLANPPFNGAPGNQLYPEVFLRHIFDLWGPKTPTVMFAPMGFRLNQRRQSKRFRWCRDSGAKITSIVTLPLNTFPDVEFHSEILIFNVGGILPHYFLPEEALQ